MRQKTRQRRRHHHLGGAACAVVAFHRDAEPLLRQRRAIDALRTGLHERPARRNCSMISVQNRPVPATCQGCAAQASRSRAAALARSDVRPTPVPKRAKPRARLASGIAQVGTEQPSVAQTSCDSSDAGQIFERRLDQALHRMRRLGRSARGRRRWRRRRTRKPACLPEQLLWTALAVPPPRASACADGWWIGQCAPHLSADAVEPRERQHPRRGRDMVRLAGMRGAGQRQLLGAKAVEVGSAAFDQRQRLQRLHRRARIDRALDVAQRQHRPPPASTTATAPVCRLSTSVPRRTSTRMGLLIGNVAEVVSCHVSVANHLY